MKSAALLVVVLLSCVALSGCAEKPATPTPSTSTTVTTRTSPSATTSPSPTNTSAPAPQQAFKGIIKWGNPNEADRAVTIADGARTLEAKVHVNTTSTGAYSVQGPGTPPSGKPFVVVIDPDGVESKMEFNAVTAGTCQPSTGSSCAVEPQPLTKTIAVSKAGSWKAGVRGTGNNVQADVSLMAVFT